MPHSTSRRQFLQTTAVAGIGYWVAAGATARESKSPNEQIAMAAIGLHGKGQEDATDAGNHGRMVAICDVDEHFLGEAGEKRFPQAKRYADFRKMLDEMGKQIDAVTVSTPDHTHAPAALMAMRMGKHCYCQKPLTHTIYEARLMAHVAREQKVATQMGNQFTADNALRNAAAVIRAGALGPVKEVHVWTDRPKWPQGIKRPQTKPCPANLKWELWLGPAPQRPFANGYHPFNWRGWWDFGTGAFGDMACHTVNMPYMALDLRDPIAVQAETTGHNKESYPGRSVITFEFAAAGNRPALKLFWYDGGKRPGKEIMGEMRSIYKNETAEYRLKNKGDFLRAGCVVVGEKAMLYAPGDYAELRQSLSGGRPLPKVKWVESPGHFEEWIRAIRGGTPAMSNFPDYAGSLTETVLLGNLAVWLADKEKEKGPRIEWDAKSMKSTNVAGLEPIIKPTYSAGYSLDA